MWTRKFSIGLSLLSIVVLMGVFASQGAAIDGRAGEEIKTVAELKELEQKGLLTHGQVLSFEELIEDFGKTIPIVETTDRSLERTSTRGHREWTEKRKGMASVAENNALVNHKGGGYPFPDVTKDDPKAGIKAFWNFEYLCNGDDFRQVGWQYFLTDTKGNIKELAGDSSRLYWGGRTDMEPVPEIGNNTEELWYKYIINFTKPFASKGLAQLEVKYIDPNKLQDLWVFVPGLRRITRVGAGNRCDCLGGFVFNQDDANMWSGNSTLFNYELLEEKELLVNTLWSEEQWQSRKGIVPSAHFTLPILEKRTVWKIKQTPKDPNYCYSKRIYYSDPETWHLVWMEMYDRSGELWKTEQQVFSLFPQPESQGGSGIMCNVQGDTLDFKIYEGGPYYQNDVRFNEGLEQGLFSLDALRRAGR